MRSRVSGLAAVIVAAAAVHCSSADTPPLGGPFGGTAAVTPPPGAGSSGDGGAATDTDAAPAASEDAGCGKPVAFDQSATPPTFSQLYANYFAVNTPGGCAQSVCHVQMDNASDAYNYLQTDTNAAYCGPPNCLASLPDECTSVLAWLGGQMPLTGTLSDPQAARDIAAWAAAGSKNN